MLLWIIMIVGCVFLAVTAVEKNPDAVVKILEGEYYNISTYNNHKKSIEVTTTSDRLLNAVKTSATAKGQRWYFEKAEEEKRQPLLIRHFSVHNLRHTFCTRFCENETNLKVIQEIMGHADIETTMNIYAEATAQKKQESFTRLEGKIKIS